MMIFNRQYDYYYFIYEDNRRGLLLGPGKEISDSGSAHSNIKFNKLAGRAAYEWNFSLPSHCFRQ